MAFTTLAAFEELLDRQSFTRRQRDLANTHIAGLRDFCARSFKMAETVFTMGSFARGTVCAGERDVDLMAPFSDDYWARYKGDSREFLYAVRKDLNDGYGSTDVSAREVAVALDFTDIRVELVPCFTYGDGYLMPDGSRGWKATNPRFHTSYIAARDAALAGKLKSVVKLLKVWNFGNGTHLRSFHVEMLVAQLDAAPILAWPHEVKWLLERLPAGVRTTLPDPWARGGNVDAALSFADREQAAKSMEADASRAAKAELLRAAGNEELAIGYWRIIYGKDRFPAYG